MPLSKIPPGWNWLQDHAKQICEMANEPGLQTLQRDSFDSRVQTSAGLAYCLKVRKTRRRLLRTRAAWQEAAPPSCVLPLPMLACFISVLFSCCLFEALHGHGLAKPQACSRSWTALMPSWRQLGRFHHRNARMAESEFRCLASIGPAHETQRRGKKPGGPFPGVVRLRVESSEQVCLWTAKVVVVNLDLPWAFSGIWRAARG